MIFITVGTTPYPFLRIRGIVLKIVQHQKQAEEIIFQHGITPSVAHKVIKNFSFLPYSKMKSYMVKARIVISHGGPATIYQAIAAGKIPYIIPRKKTFDEHVDDHQVFFSAFMEKKGTVRVITDTGGEFLPNSRKISLSTQVNKQLTRYLTSLMKS